MCLVYRVVINSSSRWQSGWQGVFVSMVSKRKIQYDTILWLNRHGGLIDARRCAALTCTSSTRSWALRNCTDGRSACIYANEWRKSVPPSSSCIRAHVEDTRNQGRHPKTLRLCRYASVRECANYNYSDYTTTTNVCRRGNEKFAINVITIFIKINLNKSERMCKLFGRVRVGAATCEYH